MAGGRFAPGTGPGQGPAKGASTAKPKPHRPLDTSPERQAERSVKGNFLRAQMRAWRERQEAENPEWTAAARPLSRPEIEALARSHAPDAIDTLVEVASSPRTAAVARVTAANSLLDRGYGRTREKQSVEISGSLDGPAVHVYLPGNERDPEAAEGSTGEVPQ